MVAFDTLARPTSGIRFQQPQTRAFLAGQDGGLGTLFVAEQCLSWVNDAGAGFSLAYPSISIHAISRDTAAFPHDHIYAMVDVAPSDIPGLLQPPSQHDAEMDDDDDDGSDHSSPGITEVRFAPMDVAVLDQLYKSISDCQVLHPDPAAEGDSDGEAFGDPEADEWDENGQGDAPTPAEEAMDE